MITAMALVMVLDSGAAQLAAKAELAWPLYLDHTSALEHATAARAAATSEISAELLMAVAAVESHFHPDALSRVDTPARVRKTGRWPSRKRGAWMRPPYFCGVLQARAMQWHRCLAFRDLETGYAQGAAELATWLHRTKNLAKALAGHGCGNAGLVTGCKRYAQRVHRQYHKLVGAKS